MSSESNSSQTSCVKSSIARFIDARIDSLKGLKSELEIASDLGCESTIKISMLALAQYFPDHAKLLFDIFGCPLEANEEAILMNKWRAVGCKMDALSEVRIRAAIDVMIEVMFGQQR